MVGTLPVCCLEMNRVQIAIRWGARCSANAFDTTRPLNGKGVGAPYRLKKFAISSLGEPVGKTGRVGKATLNWVCRWSFSLFSSRVLQAVAAGAHVPKIPSYEVALQLVVMKHRRER